LPLSWLTKKSDGELAQGKPLGKLEYRRRRNKRGGQQGYGATGKRLWPKTTEGSTKKHYAGKCRMCAYRSTAQYEVFLRMLAFVHHLRTRGFLTVIHRSLNIVPESQR